MDNDFICISASKGATHRLVLLHGWGADADDLVPLGEELTKGLHGVNLELIAMRAPQKHPETFGRQWYRLFPPDWAAVPDAINDLQYRIKSLSNSVVPLEKTVIFGFSQGGAMALDGGLNLPVAGLICCSGYLHPNWIPPTKSPPVFLTHGLHDEVVPCEASKKIISALKDNKLNADLLLFDGGHEIPIELISRFQHVLQKWFV